MSTTLQQLRLQGLKADRKAQELEERERHASRLLSNRTKEVADLEQAVAKLEKDMHVKEERWRLADNDRLRLYFNQRLGGNHEPHARSRSGADGLGSGLSNQGFKSTGGPTAQEQLHQDQVTKLTHEVARLQDELRHKDSVIRRLKSWNDADDYVAEGEDALKGVMEQERVKFQAAHDQESKEMADAAYQTIKTLREMLEQKKTQVRSKEEQIDRLREQLAEERERHAEQFSKLQAEVTATGKSTLASLHAMVQNKDKPPSSTGVDRRVAEVSRQQEAELQKIQKEVEHLRVRLRDQEQEVDSLQTQLRGERRGKAVLQEQHDEAIRGLEAKVKEEREKREKQAKSRADKSEKLVAEFKQRMLEYEMQIQALQDTNEVARLNAMSNAGARTKKEESKAGDKLLTDPVAARKQEQDSKKKEDELLKLADKKEKDAKTAAEREKQALKLEWQRKVADVEKRLAEEQRKSKDLAGEKEELRAKLLTAREQANTSHSRVVSLEQEIEQLAGRRGTGAGGLTYTDLQDRVKELQNDVRILEAQRKTVIAINPASSAFEYIGDPLPLDQAAELRSAEALVKGLKTWLARPTNERLSVLQIFEQMDLQASGEVSARDFEGAMARLGVMLRPSEMQILRDVLDPRNEGYLQYRSLVRELLGVPQLDFMNKSIIKLARVVLGRDLSQTQFLALVDPNTTASMTLEQFSESMQACKAPDLAFDPSEVESLFRAVTNAEGRTVGLKLSTRTLAERVYDGVRALLVDQVRAALARSQ